ncbi:MAG: polysaccharide deacetylase family protein [bacterium]
MRLNFWLNILGILILNSVIIHAESNIAPFYSHGKGSDKRITLTFDDGPSKTTEKLLELLKKKDVKAAFFVLGVNIKRFPLLIKRIHEDGHELGNHTYGHINFGQYKNPDIREKLKQEILSTDEMISEIIGIHPYFVRMPNGTSKSWVKEVIGELNLSIVNWSFGCDWKKMDLESMSKAYIKAVEPGAVLLFHDTSRNIDERLKIIEKVINYALDNEYVFVTVSEMFELKKAESTAKDLPEK